MSSEPLTFASLRRVLPRVIESPWVPEGEIYVFNDPLSPADLPAEWKSMTAAEKLRWSVENGLLVAIKGVGAVDG